MRSTHGSLKRPLHHPVVMYGKSRPCAMLTPLPPHYYQPINSQVESLIGEDVRANPGTVPIEERGVSTL
jgi:hypothetical protein